MRVLQGLIASPGLAIGVLRVYTEKPGIEVAGYCVVENPEHEVELLREAVQTVVQELKVIAEKAPEESQLVDAYMLMLETLVNEAEELVLKDKLCSETAINIIHRKYDQLLAESGSELINLRRSDLRSLVSRLVTHLRKISLKEETTWKNSIVLANELSPLDFMKLKDMGLKGIVTLSGGPTSHVAILARTYGIPYLVIPDSSLYDLQGRTCIVDALTGKLVVEPSEEEAAKYNELFEKYDKMVDLFKKFSRLQVRTLDGIHVKVNCNIGLLEDLRLLDEYGCDGVGLFRVEFMYIRRRNPPPEEELREVLSKVARFAKGREAVIRLPDLGADKPVEYIDFKGENNPQLGLRGIRLLLKYKNELLYPFIRAFLYSSIESSNMKLLIPMVTSLEEVMEVTNTISEVVSDLNRKLSLNIKPPELGIMIETPATVIMLDAIIEKTPVSFISIGTNDLTQYLLAVDRTNPRLSHLYSELHPAVLRSIKHIAETISRAERPVDVEVCGEMASQTKALPILLSLDVKKLSVPPYQVGKVKYYVSNINISKIKSRVLATILTSTNHREVEKAVENLYGEFQLEYFP